jgi:tol-pal system protein YbgF
MSKVSRSPVNMAAVTLSCTMASALAASDKKDTDLILAELRQLQAQMSQLQRTQGDLERALNQLISRVEEETSLRQTVVDTRTTVEEIKESLSILNSRLDDTNARLGNVGREIASLRQTQRPLIISPEGMEGTEQSAGGSAAGTGESSNGAQAPVASSVVAAVPNPIELYNQAYTDYNQMRYPLAISGFKDVIERYPESDLADNAQYWIGECYLAQRRFKEALTAFDTVLSRFPDSNKLPEASYRKATALEALGQREEAIEQLELVIVQFPRTLVERIARERLKKLRSYRPSPPARYR